MKLGGQALKWSALAAVVLIALVVIAYLALPRQQQAPADKTVTDVTMRIVLPAPTETLRHTMRLKCQGGKSISGTEGFTMDIKSQADAACGLVPRLPRGNFTCGYASSGDPEGGWGEIKGRIGQKTVNSQFAQVGDKLCPKAYNNWARFQTVWSLPEKADTKLAAKRKRATQKQKAKSKILKQQRIMGLQKMKEKIAEDNRRNQKYLAEPGQ